VIEGWYVAVRPGEPPGDSTAWYASFWDFCAAYLSQRFGREWCLSPEQSLALHAGNRTVPAQLIVRTPKGGNKPTALPHGTSLFDVRNAMPKPGRWLTSLTLCRDVKGRALGWSVTPTTRLALQPSRCPGLC
jgi:hypothetical protein